MHRSENHSPFIEISLAYLENYLKNPPNHCAIKRKSVFEEPEPKCVKSECDFHATVVETVQIVDKKRKRDDSQVGLDNKMIKNLYCMENTSK
jgi:hypothetical protein